MYELIGANSINSQIIFCEFILMLLSLITILISLLNSELLFLSKKLNIDFKNENSLNDPMNINYLFAMVFNTFCTIMMSIIFKNQF
jgi:hypothetical protein